MDINELMADFMRFEKKDIIKQIPCPDGIDNCPTYHCEVIGQFYIKHDFRVDVGDWNPKSDLVQAFLCAEKWLEDGQSTMRVDTWKDGLLGELFYTCTLNDTGGTRAEETEQSASFAMCKAVLKAEGIDHVAL